MFEPFSMFLTIINTLTKSVKLVFDCTKTEQDRFEELEFVMESVLYNKWGYEIYPKDVRKWFASLPPKYNEPKYEKLKRHVYWKMRVEGRLKHIFDIPSPHSTRC